MAISYVVQKGDTLTRIANRYGITLNALFVANPQLQPGEYIYPGQIVYIPDFTYRQYVVRTGDTMYLIARQFGLTVKEVILANPQIQNPNILKVGQVINIPRPKEYNIVQTNQEYGYDDLVEDITALKNKYPFIQTEIIGKSVMGKSIYAIRLGIGSKEIFYSGDWHANEHLTGPLLMKFVEDYSRAYSQNRTLNGYDIKYLYRNASIWIVPMVNPDGVELVQEGITTSSPYYQTVMSINNWSRDFSSWSANIRGVDLNHQWPADWEEEAARSPSKPSPKKYGGPKPLSEPESISVYNFTLKHSFRMVLTFHSQGQVIYWGFKDLEPAESRGIVNRFAVLTGYIPEKTAYSGAGYKDWFIQEYRKPGFTIEVGIGVNPLPITQFPQIYRENLSMLLEAPLL